MLPSIVFYRYVITVLLAAIVMHGPPDRAHAFELSDTLYLVSDPKLGTAHNAKPENVLTSSKVIRIASSGPMISTDQLAIENVILLVKFQLQPDELLNLTSLRLYVNDQSFPEILQSTHFTTTGILVPLNKILREGMNGIEVALGPQEGETVTQKWSFRVISKIGPVKLNLKNLTIIKEGMCRNPVISPDGKWVAYELLNSYQECQIAVMDINGEHTRILPFQAQQTVVDSFSLSEDDDDFKYAFGISWTPDSRDLVATVNFDLFIVDLTTNPMKKTQLTKGEAKDSQPDCNPMTGEIAFISNRGGSPAIYLIDPDKPLTEPRKLTTKSGLFFSPRWSPDGRSIAYHFRDIKGAPYDIGEMGADGTNTRNITENTTKTEDCYPTWSPDGSKIAFHSNRDIKVYSKLSNQTILVATSVELPHRYGPAWSPDGTRIVFTANQDFRPLYIADLKEGESGELTADFYPYVTKDVAAQNFECVWSPDGKQIIFQSFQSRKYDLWACEVSVPTRVGRLRIAAPYHSKIHLQNDLVGYAPEIKGPGTYFGGDSLRIAPYSYRIIPDRGREESGLIWLKAIRREDIVYHSKVKTGVDLGSGAGILLPGFPQYRRNQFFSSALFGGSAAGLAGLSLFFASMKQSEYKRYQKANNYPDMADANTKMYAWEARQKSSGLVAAGIYAACVGDALLKPKYLVYDSPNDAASKRRLPWKSVRTSLWGDDLEKGALGIVTWDDRAEVWIRKSTEAVPMFFGRTAPGYTDKISFTVTLNPGRYEVTIKVPGRKQQKSVINIEPLKKTTWFVDRAEPSTSLTTRVLTGLVPGLNQALIQKDWRRAVEMVSLFGIGVIGWQINEIQFNANKTDYQDALTSADALHYRSEADKNGAWRDGFIGLTFGAYFINMQDAIRGPR